MNSHALLNRIALPLLAAGCTLVSAAAAASPANADSIVYAKQGNLFLSAPDGSKGYQLTFDGGYSSPSQATNGTIGALRHGQLVRMDRSGHLLNPPISAMGSPGRASSANIGGPYEPRLSPDGTRFAYYFYVENSFDDLENNVRWIDTGKYTAWTYADHFTSPVSGSEYNRSLAQPEWLTNDRLLGAEGPDINVVTWKLGTGHGYTYDAGQWWFTFVDPPDQWGVTAPHYYADPALSPDGSRLAMTDGGGDQSDLVLASTNGPAWVGEPPYPEIDYTQIDFTDPQSDVPRPTLRCQTATGAYSNPTWSSDSREVAYASTDGVHVMSVPADWDCSKVADHVLVRGGSDPAFGPSDVNLAQKPVPPGPSPTPNPQPHPGPRPSGGVALRGLAIAPHRFRVAASRAASARRGGALVRFTLNRAGRVVLTVSSRRRPRGRLVIAGAGGVNSVRFTGWLSGHRLAPGRYQLVAAAGAGSSSVTFVVSR